MRNALYKTKTKIKIKTTTTTTATAAAAAAAAATATTTTTTTTTWLTYKRVAQFVSDSWVSEFLVICNRVRQNKLAP